MIIDEQFDADEILRDVDERYIDAESEDPDSAEEMRELSFGTILDETANFSEMAEDLAIDENLWD